MADIDYQRDVLPALLALPVLGIFFILVTSSGGPEDRAGIGAARLPARNPRLDQRTLRPSRKLKLTR